MGGVGVGLIPLWRHRERLSARPGHWLRHPRRPRRNVDNDGQTSLCTGRLPAEYGLELDWLGVGAD